MAGRQTASGRAMGPDKGAPPPTALGAAPTDISESFRAARSGLSQISTDLEQLRRRAASMVKSAKRRAGK